jgi:hypothetical protein
MPDPRRNDVLMALRLLALWLVLAGLSAAGLCLLLTGARLTEQRCRVRPLRSAPEAPRTALPEERTTLPV